MDLLEVTLTLAAPEMAPLTTTTAALLDPTAAVNWASVDTVVVVPPRPPVVLERQSQSDCTKEQETIAQRKIPRTLRSEWRSQHQLHQ